MSGLGGTFGTSGSGTIGVGRSGSGTMGGHAWVHSCPVPTRSARSPRSEMARCRCCGSSSSTPVRCSSRVGRRRHEIVAWLEHLRPDVVCLQEIWQDGAREHRRLDRRAHARPGGTGSSAARPSASGCGPTRAFAFGSAVLSRWPIEDSVPPAAGPRRRRSARRDCRGSCCTCAPPGSTCSPATSRRRPRTGRTAGSRCWPSTSSSPPPAATSTTSRRADSATRCRRSSAATSTPSPRATRSASSAPSLRSTGAPPSTRTPGASPVTVPATRRTGGPTRSPRRSTSTANASTTSSSAIRSCAAGTPAACWPPTSPSHAAHGRAGQRPRRPRRRRRLA